MIYLLMPVMKKLLPILRPAALFGIGLIMAVFSAAVDSIPASMRMASLSATAQILQTASPTPTTVEDVSRIGSTDGIVLMGIMIVLIVVTPVLFRPLSHAK
jgi:hypothetical protein